MAQSPRIYTPEEATRIIPQLMEVIPELRHLRDNIFQERDKCDVEELTSFGVTGETAETTKEKMDQYKANIQQYESAFEKKLRILDEAGCQLKSLEPGLVDFYSKAKDNLIYLCWREGEEQIRFWHSLAGGFTGRQPLS